MSFPDAVKALAQVRPIPGRMELAGVTKTGGQIFVDYAHTEDALNRVVASVLAMPGAGEVSIIVGCGGDRDKAKRPALGRAAAKAHRVCITDANPRTEDAPAIRSAVPAGCSEIGRGKAVAIAIRRMANIQAILELPENGTLVICGKGHEDYQEVPAEPGSRTLSREVFNDVEVVRKVLERLLVP